MPGVEPGKIAREGRIGDAADIKAQIRCHFLQPLKRSMASRTDRFMLADHDFRSRTSPRRPARTARRGSAALPAALSTHGSFLSPSDKEYSPLTPRHERDCPVSDPVPPRPLPTRRTAP